MSAVSARKTYSTNGTIGAFEDTGRKAILDAKAALPMRVLLNRLCPNWQQQNPLRANDRKNSFSADDRGWRDHGTDSKGDQIGFLERFEGLSRKDAIRRFNELANEARTPTNGSTNASCQSSSSSSSLASSMAFSPNWSSAVTALTCHHIEAVAAWRGWTTEFVTWLRDSEYVGFFSKLKASGKVYKDRLAFPMHDETGRVVGVHHVAIGENGFLTIGSTRPWIIGNQSAKRWLIFESQWDALSVLHTYGFGLNNDCAYLITRGAGNGKFASVVPAGIEAVAVMQNDSAAEKWLLDVQENCACL